jgi:ribosomal protein S18 acetylase RimI-like enzyme
MPTVRNAGPDDAAQLAKVAEQTFRDTFGSQNTAENMDLHCRLSYSEELQGREIAAPDRATLLAVEEDRIVGFAQLRWGAAPACVVGGAPGEIQRIYVSKEWQGRGVAQALMDASFREILRRGADVAWLGVWERNPRAISFYRKLGFAAVGAHVFSLGRDPQRDIIMARPVRGDG